MAKVFIVTSGEYDDYAIEAVFATLELAQQYIAGFTIFNAIQEWEISESLDSADRDDNPVYHRRPRN